MATESILLDALRIPARYADEVLEAMESKKKVKKLDVDFEIVDDPEEILRIAKNFGYKEKKWNYIVAEIKRKIERRKLCCKQFFAGTNREKL